MKSDEKDKLNNNWSRKYENCIQIIFNRLIENTFHFYGIYYKICVYWYNLKTFIRENQRKGVMMNSMWKVHSLLKYYFKFILFTAKMCTQHTHTHTK